MSLPLAAPAVEDAAPEAEAPDPEQVAPRRPGRPRGPRTSGRTLRRIAALVIVASLAAAGVSISLGWRTPLTEAWTSIRSHSFAGTWTAIRKRSFSETWAGIRRHASQAFIAIRRHTPLDEADSEAKASIASTPGSLREGTAIARGTHRRTKTHAAKRRGD